jgi:hypothetical protein
LVDQLDEASHRGWLGEIERLDHILAAIDDKLDEIQRARRRVDTVGLIAPPRRRQTVNLSPRPSWAAT